jgi:hypothetical protein
MPLPHYAIFAITGCHAMISCHASFSHISHFHFFAISSLLAAFRRFLLSFHVLPLLLFRPMPPPDAMMIAAG